METATNIPMVSKCGALCVENARWFVVYTRPRMEAFAADHLTRQSYVVFCPLVRKTVRHARQLAISFAPLFPNYLFVSIDMSRDPWRRVNGTRGVSHVIAAGGQPIPVPFGIVESLQSRTRPDGSIDWSTSMSVGQAVQVGHGSFSGLIGTLEHIDAAGRVSILLEILGRSVSVAMESGTVRPAT